MNNSNFYPLISIVMASKNAEKTIEQAIVSVLSQCYESIEFIIFDSLSTDGTINIVNKYINKIAHFKVERDSSPADAINKAIKISTGEYIMWLATDDWLETDHVSKIVDLFRKSDVDFQYGNLIYIENEKITFKQSGEVDYMNKIKYKMPRLNSPTICVKSSLFESVGLFNIDYKFACDYEWLLRSRKIGHVGYYNNNINVHHRLGGLSTKYFISAANEVRKASIIHGGSAILANYIFLLIILKGYFKISLKVILPNLVYKNLMGYIRSNYRL